MTYHYDDHPEFVRERHDSLHTLLEACEPMHEAANGLYNILNVNPFTGKVCWNGGRGTFKVNNEEN